MVQKGLKWSKMVNKWFKNGSKTVKKNGTKLIKKCSKMVLKWSKTDTKMVQKRFNRS